MKRALTVLAMLAASATAFVDAAADELRFNRLFVVGDSLSDAGTYSLAAIAGSGGALPSGQYRFLTNALDGSSLTYSELLGNSLGIPVTPNIVNGVPAAAGTALGNDIAVGGTNYAQGGARVTNPTGVGNAPAAGITTVPLSTQIDRLLASNPGFGSTDLLIVWGGNNDVIINASAAGVIGVGTATTNVTQAANELAAQVRRLKEAGAKTVIVVTVPDIGATPLGVSAGPAGSAVFTGLSDAFNAVLRAQVPGQAVLVDAGKLLAAVQANPARFGFTAPGAANVPACPGSALTCVQGANASADSEQRIFADGVHPTAAAHELFAEAALAGLRAATQTGAISVATLTALRQQSLTLENRLNPTVLFNFDVDGTATRRAVGDIDAFGAIEGGYYSSDTQQVTPGLTGQTQVIKLGADVAVASNATVGIGLSLDHGQVDFEGSRGGFDSRLIVGALFGQAALSRNFYVNAAAGGGLIDVYNIDRRFNLGPATESYDSETTGTYLFARGGGGAMFRPTEEFLLNPFAHFTHESVEIDGFTESSGAASLSFGDTEYTSNRLSGGLSVIYSPMAAPDWRFNLRGSLEHDLKDDELFVALGPDTSTLSSVSAPRPDQTWGYIQGSIVRTVGPASFLSMTVSGSVGLSGTTGLVGSIAYKIAF